MSATRSPDQVQIGDEANPQQLSWFLATTNPYMPLVGYEEPFAESTRIDNLVFQLHYGTPVFDPLVEFACLLKRVCEGAQICGHVSINVWVMFQIH